jgi:hypothetical protein
MNIYLWSELILAHHCKSARRKKMEMKWRFVLKLAHKLMAYVIKIRSVSVHISLHGLTNIFKPLVQSLNLKN